MASAGTCNTNDAGPGDPLARTGLQPFREKYKALTLAVYAGSMTLDIFNVTGLAFAQRSVAEHFQVPEAQASWTLSAYSLTFGSFLLLSGRAGDIFGHKQIYCVGLLLFSIISALEAGIASSFIGLAVLRTFQGIAAASTIPTAYALVANSYEGKARDMAVAFLGACQCVGTVLGTILGGAFSITPIGYRGLFWLSFGAGTLCSLLGFILIPPSPTHFSGLKKLDYGGVIIITAAALVLVLGFTEAQGSWPHAKVIAPIVVGGCTFIVFGVYEELLLPWWLPEVDPLIPRHVWTYRNFVLVLFITACGYGIIFILILNGSQFLVAVQDRSSIIASVMFLPFATGALICMPFLGRFFNHRFFPPKWVIAVGQCFSTAGLVLFSRNDISSEYWRFTFPGLILFSFGASSFFVNFINIAIASAKPEEQGLVSGIVQTAAQLATALAFGIASSFISGGTREQLLEQYRESFYLAMGLAMTAVLVSVLCLRPMPSNEQPAEDQEKERV